jgi:hypothetical protein
MKWTPPCTFGLISDTHGTLRPEAVEALRGVDGILHVGDIGNRDVLRMLGKVAPVVAVEGNVDRDPTATNLPDTEVIGVGRYLIYLIHDLDKLDLDPGVAGLSVVVSGHSHEASVQTKDGILYVNPGSAGPLRPGAIPTVAILRITDQGLQADIVQLPG